MLPLYFGPCRRFGRKVMHKANRDFVLDSASVGVPGYEIAQHPVFTIFAGFNPQTSTLKPRHFRSSPVLARETAVDSLHCGRGPPPQSRKAENATLAVCPAPEDKQGLCPGVPVPARDAGASRETFPPLQHQRMVRVLCWSSYSVTACQFAATTLPPAVLVVTSNIRTTATA